MKLPTKGKHHVSWPVSYRSRSQLHKIKESKANPKIIGSSGLFFTPKHLERVRCELDAWFHGVTYSLTLLYLTMNLTHCKHKPVKGSRYLHTCQEVCCE